MVVGNDSSLLNQTGQKVASLKREHDPRAVHPQAVGVWQFPSGVRSGRFEACYGRPGFYHHGVTGPRQRVGRPVNQTVT